MTFKQLLRKHKVDYPDWGPFFPCPDEIPTAELWKGPALKPFLPRPGSLISYFSKDGFTFKKSSWAEFDRYSRSMENRLLDAKSFVSYRRDTECCLAEKGNTLFFMAYCKLDGMVDQLLRLR